MYVIVDIETTGSFSKTDGITEIAAVKSDGKKILGEFHSLINPGKSIPGFIQSLTGIHPEMLQDAPFFEEIEDELFRFLDGNIFVAHNVQFDYNFIRSAFERQGRIYNSKRLCTVRLSRKLIPEASGHSLGKITNFLGIVNEAPHRAMGDAMATTHLFHDLIKRDQSEVIASYLKSNSHETILPLHLNKSDFVNLPYKAGVYLFKNSEGRIIYIGKAKNLKKRVSSHFTGSPQSRRRHHFHVEIKRIDFEVTGSEVTAALREDELIRKHWPKYNRAQKQRVIKYGIFAYKDQNEKTRLGIQKILPASKPIVSYYSNWQAKNRLMELVKTYNLMPELCGLPSIWNESSSEKEHEKGIDLMKKEIKNENNAFVLVEEGRGVGEKCVILIENNDFKGYGFLDESEALCNKEDLLLCIEFGSLSSTSNSIVASHIEKNRPEIIEIE